MTRSSILPIALAGLALALLAATSGCIFDRMGVAPGGDVASSDVTPALSDLAPGEVRPDLHDPRDITIAKPPDGVAPLDGMPPVFPANVGPSYLSLGSGSLNVKGKLELDTTNNTVSPKLPAGVDLWGTTSYSILTLKNPTVSKDATIRTKGKRPLVIVASGKVVIDGLLDLSADGSAPGAGGSYGGSAGHNAAGCGGGYAGAEGQFDQGGSGGSYGGQGGKGGGTPGPSAKAPCTPGGGSYTVLDCITPLVGGYGGGGGAPDAWPFTVGGAGGGGGGAIQISAQDSLEIRGSGVVNAGGGRDLAVDLHHGSLEQDRAAASPAAPALPPPRQRRRWRGWRRVDLVRDERHRGAGLLDPGPGRQRSRGDVQHRRGRGQGEREGGQPNERRGRRDRRRMDVRPGRRRRGRGPHLHPRLELLERRDREPVDQQDHHGLRPAPAVSGQQARGRAGGLRDEGSLLGRWVLVGAATILLGVGCGYRPVSGTLPGGARSVHVLVPDPSRTLDPELSPILARALCLELGRAGIAASAAGEADAVLHTHVLDLVDGNVSLGRGPRRVVGARELSLRLELRLADREDRTLWRSGLVEVHEETPVPRAAPATAQTARRMALEQLGAEAARQTVLRLGGGGRDREKVCQECLDKKRRSHADDEASGQGANRDSSSPALAPPRRERAR